MAIRYALFENKMLHASANEYMARTRAIGTADFDMIAARMVEMGTTVTKSDILAVFEDMSNAAESLLLDGFNINFDGLCNMKCSIKGIFAGPTDSFDAARHSLAVNASIGGIKGGELKVSGTFFLDNPSFKGIKGVKSLFSG